MPNALPKTISPALFGKRAAVIVFSYFPSDPRVYRATLALAEAGAEVDLFCLRKGGEPKKETFAVESFGGIPGLTVTRANIKKSRAGKLAYVKQYLGFTGAAFAWLSGRSLKHRYDLVHVHNMPDFLVFSALFAKLLGTKVVLDLHDPMPEVFIAKYGLKPEAPLVRALRLIEKLSIGFADLVLTPNLAFRKLFASRSGPKSKIAIVMNSPREEIFPLRPPASRWTRKKEASFVLMYHGTLVERHGLHTAVKAVARLTEDFPGLRFHIYGERTPYLSETIFPLIEKLGLEKKVVYFGEVSQEAIATAIAGCDLGLIPNLRSVFTELNFPTRIFEYLALGKPVLVPITPGIRDYFEPETMLFFPWQTGEEKEVETLTSEIRWVLGHPLETKAHVERGQAVYRKHLWRAERENFLRLIANLLN